MVEYLFLVSSMARHPLSLKVKITVCGILINKAAVQYKTQYVKEKTVLKIEIQDSKSRSHPQRE